jgi:N6-adenosine-specific RNA methylase IME4
MIRNSLVQTTIMQCLKPWGYGGIAIVFQRKTSVIGMQGQVHGYSDTILSRKR